MSNKKSDNILESNFLQAVKVWWGKCNFIELFKDLVEGNSGWGGFNKEDGAFKFKKECQVQFFSKTPWCSMLCQQRDNVAEDRQSERNKGGTEINTQNIDERDGDEFNSYFPFI